MMEYNNPNDPWMHTGYDPYKDLDDDRMLAGCLQAAGVIAFLLCLLFGSCTTTQYVPVIEHKTDTLMVIKHQHDSIHVHDSIMVSEKGDTILIEWWHTKYIEKQVHDTTYISKTDTIPQPYPVVKEVPAKLTWWQQTRIHLADILLWLLLLVGIIYVGKKHIKRLLGE